MHIVKNVYIFQHEPLSVNSSEMRNASFAAFALSTFCRRMQIRLSWCHKGHWRLNDTKLPSRWWNPKKQVSVMVPNVKVEMNRWCFIYSFLAQKLTAGSSRRRAVNRGHPRGGKKTESTSFTNRTILNVAAHCRAALPLHCMSETC